MNEKEFSPEESLSVIHRSIANFKTNYRESARIFLLWGWILTLASLSNFIILVILDSREAYHSMGLFSLANWSVFSIAGFTMQYFVLRKATREKKVFSLIESYFKSLWTVTVAAFIVATFLCFRLGINPPPVMLLIAGLATTTSGILIKYRPLIIGGIAFFAFSIATTYFPNEYSALVVAMAIICGYLVPGYFLKSAKA